MDDQEKQNRLDTLKQRWRCKIQVDTKFIYDAVLGLSDGLTVPFALTAGLASIGSTRIVILGGLAELVAGAISMGLGGFVGAKSEVEAYESALRKCDHLVNAEPHQVYDIVSRYFSEYSILGAEQRAMTEALMESNTNLKNFLMQTHFRTEKPNANRPYVSAITLGASYFLGGFIALIPYFCVKRDQVNQALFWSIGIMGVIMLVFGYTKTCIVRGWKGKDNVKAAIGGALQMLVIGTIAVGAAVGLVRAIESGSAFHGSS